jgi:hypothetical protein
VHFNHAQNTRLPTLEKLDKHGKRDAQEVFALVWIRKMEQNTQVFLKPGQDPI